MTPHDVLNAAGELAGVAYCPTPGCWEASDLEGDYLVRADTLSEARAALLRVLEARDGVTRMLAELDGYTPPGA